MNTKSNEPVHPHVYPHPEFGHMHLMESGLTKREYFAAMALQGYISATPPESNWPSPNEAAKDAVEFADALIKALNDEATQ